MSGVINMTLRMCCQSMESEHKNSKHWTERITTIAAIQKESINSWYVCVCGIHTVDKLCKFCLNASLLNSNLILDWNETEFILRNRIICIHSDTNTVFVRFFCLHRKRKPKNIYSTFSLFHIARKHTHTRNLQWYVEKVYSGFFSPSLHCSFHCIHFDVHKLSIAMWFNTKLKIKIGKMNKRTNERWTTNNSGNGSFLSKIEHGTVIGNGMKI